MVITTVNPKNTTKPVTKATTLSSKKVLSAKQTDWKKTGPVIHNQVLSLHQKEQRIILLLKEKDEEKKWYFYNKSLIGSEANLL